MWEMITGNSQRWSYGKEASKEQEFKANPEKSVSYYGMTSLAAAESFLLTKETEDQRSNLNFRFIL